MIFLVLFLPTVSSTAGLRLSLQRSALTVLSA
jgi:hypothetical protein